MPKCCLYERDGEYTPLFTLDDACPAIVGWKKVGEWGVGDRDDCSFDGNGGGIGRITDPPGITVQPGITVPLGGLQPHPILEYLRMLEM